MSNNWYETDHWYEPLGQTVREETREEPGHKAAPGKKGKKRGWRWIGAAVLLLTLLVGSSLIFGGGANSAVRPPETPESEGNEEMPEEFSEFFENFYEKVEGSPAEIRIEQGQLPRSFRLKLNPQQGETMSLQELYARCADSIVAISGYEDGKSGYNWGTGVIISADGLILTNTHVIEDCDRATVTLFDDRTLDAKLIGADTISDVALLEIEATDLPAAEFGESASLQVGEPVAAIGNPLGEEFRCTLTDGIISAIERGVNYKGRSMNLLQTNTALNEGNSGGALFNMYGQVIGVTNMKMMSSLSSIEGIGFAIPSSTVQEVVNSLVRFGQVRGRPSIGITVGPIPDNAREHYDLPAGLYISDVVPSSDAAAKGILPGDILTQVNHQPVTATADVAAIKDGMQVGDRMLLSIWRKGETFEVEVELMDTNDVYG